MCGRCRSARQVERSSSEGRYPLRTNVYNAILSNDLANSQVSPYEVTTPQILRTKNYKSAMFGKFHLAGPDNNEFTNRTPHVLGWDYFDGFLEGAMHPIDTTLGGQFPVVPPFRQIPASADVLMRVYTEQDGGPAYRC